VNGNADQSITRLETCHDVVDRGSTSTIRQTVLAYALRRDGIASTMAISGVLLFASPWLSLGAVDQVLGTFNHIL
jgi:hypothetical protein